MKEDIPNGWSKEAANFMRSCIQKEPKDRLGYKNGVQELKDHPWFKDFDW